VYMPREDGVVALKAWLSTSHVDSRLTLHVQLIDAYDRRSFAWATV
jgi:hypothetical protein